MKTKKSQGVNLSSPSYRRKSCFALRGRKKKNGVIQGKLRIRSTPGAFVVLGIMVVVVGTALAVAGYWPYRLSRSSVLRAAERENISESQSSSFSLGAQGLLSTASFIHSERMKLLGPVVMGVGLFILICANTVLYENRDRETQMLVAQMRSVICSVSVPVPSTDLKEIAAANSMATHYQWVSSLPAAHLNILYLQQLATSEPLLQNRHTSEQDDSKEGIYQQAGLQTEAVHHQESKCSLSHSSSHSNSCISSQTGFNSKLESGDKRNPPTGPHVKLNVYMLSASSMSTLGLDEVEAPAPWPRRCYSMNHRTNPYLGRTTVRWKEGLISAQHKHQINKAAVMRREAGLHVCVNIPGQISEPAEEQTHQSWPQLDVAGGRRYMKLENKDYSVDKLLDQLGKQCSELDKSFGSGPFQ